MHACLITHYYCVPSKNLTAQQVLNEDYYGGEKKQRTTLSIPLPIAGAFQCSGLWLEETEVGVPGQARALCSPSSEGLSLSLEQHSDS